MIEPESNVTGCRYRFSKLHYEFKRRIDGSKRGKERKKKRINGEMDYTRYAVNSEHVYTRVVVVREGDRVRMCIRVLCTKRSLTRGQSGSVEVSMASSHLEGTNMASI